jgi:hypothetical protein
VTGGGHWTESYVAWHAVRQLLPEVLKEFRPVPPMAEAIVGSVMDEQKAKEAYEAELARLNELRPPRPAKPLNALAGLGAVLLDAVQQQTPEPIERHLDGSPRTEEEIAAINAQQERTAAAHQEWEAARIGAEAAWAEADRQAAEGTALAKRIIELAEKYGSLQPSE